MDEANIKDEKQHHQSNDFQSAFWPHRKRIIIQIQLINLRNAFSPAALTIQLHTEKTFHKSTENAFEHKKWKYVSDSLSSILFFIFFPKH